MIPRRFFVLFDLLFLYGAFLASYHLVPFVQSFFMPGSFLRPPWLEALVSPAVWDGRLPGREDLFWIFVVMAPVVIVVMSVSGNYKSLINTRRRRIILGSLAASIAGLGVVTMILYALRSPGWSRLFIFSFTFLSGTALIIFHLVLRQAFLLRQKEGYYANNVVLVGAASSVNWIIQYFNDYISQINYRLIGYLRLADDQALPEVMVRDQSGRKADTPLPLLGDVADLGDLLINHPVNEVVCLHPVEGGDWIRQVVQDCDYFGVTLRVIPESLLFNEKRWMKRIYSAEAFYLPTIILKPPPVHTDAHFIKRLMDIVISFILLVLLSPIFLITALVIKITSPGLPVFYKWNVVGFKGKRFTGYKFTTMVKDADEIKNNLEDKNEMIGPVFKMGNDPRVTRVGRILRKYSINELPQLWSVLKGDMSLVGPRPAFPNELERYAFWQKRKLSVQPGITCLWQVRGRNRINDFDDWVRMDLEYIDNWSLWMDLKILYRTVWVVFRGTGS